MVSISHQVLFFNCRIVLLFYTGSLVWALYIEEAITINMPSFNQLAKDLLSSYHACGHLHPMTGELISHFSLIVFAKEVVFTAGIEGACRS